MAVSQSAALRPAVGSPRLGVMHPSAKQIAVLYERHARAWDNARSRVLVEKTWLDRFLGAVMPGASILDLGCGAGEPIARYLIASGHPVMGVDSSPSLIGLAAERFPAQTWRVGDMRGLALGMRFGGILAWDSFFHLAMADQRAMFPIFRAHAAPGAALLFTSGPSEGEAIGSFEGEALYHASLNTDAYRALLDANGFEVLAHQIEDPTCGGHTVWLARSSGEHA